MQQFTVSEGRPAEENHGLRVQDLPLRRDRRQQMRVPE